MILVFFSFEIVYRCDGGKVDRYVRHLEVVVVPQLGWQVAGLMDDEIIGPPTVTFVEYDVATGAIEVVLGFPGAIGEGDVDRREVDQAEMARFGWTLEHQG